MSREEIEEEEIDEEEGEIEDGELLEAIEEIALSDAYQDSIVQI